MEHKKKYLGFLKFLLVALSIILLNICSICFGANAYSPTQMTFEQAKYIFEYQLSNSYLESENLVSSDYVSALTFSNTNSFSSNYTNTLKEDVYTTFFNNNTITNFMTAFNNADSQYNNFLGVDQYFFCMSYDSSSNKMAFVIFPANNGIGDTVPQLYIDFISTSSTSGKKFTKIKVFVNESYPNDINVLWGEIDQLGNVSIQTAGQKSPKYFLLNSLDIDGSKVFYSYNNSGTVVYTPFPIICLHNANAFYTRTNLNSTSGTYQPYILKNFFSSSSEPDIPVDTGNTGTITNNSGETTGQIDLSGIQNGIANINQSINTQGQAIIDNQNTNTQSIINNQNNNTTQITNTLTDSADMDSTTISSGDILENFNFMADPYSNFWWDFIDGVELALLGSVRQLPVVWLGYQRSI